MKEKVAAVIKVLAVLQVIVGIVIIGWSIAFQLSYFGYVLGAAFLFSAFITYRVGMEHIDNVFK